MLFPVFRAHPNIDTGNNFIRSMTAGFFPLFIKPLYDSIGPGWSSSIWGFLGCVFIPAPFLIYRYGPWIRKLSPNATKDFT